MVRKFEGQPWITSRLLTFQSSSHGCSSSEPPWVRAYIEHRRVRRFFLSRFSSRVGCISIHFYYGEGEARGGPKMYLLYLGSGRTRRGGTSIGKGDVKIRLLLFMTDVVISSSNGESRCMGGRFPPTLRDDLIPLHLPKRASNCGVCRSQFPYRRQTTFELVVR